MRSQLHAGQLRYHDYPKLRQAHVARRLGCLSSTISSLDSGSSSSSSLALLTQGGKTALQNRSFVTLRDRLHDYQLKKLEWKANDNPSSVDAQYEFVYELAQRHPSVAVERFDMAEYAMDERVAMLYLQAMQRSGQYSNFHLPTMVSRLQQSSASNPIIVQGLSELAEHTKKLSKTKQVTATLQALAGGGSILGGGAGAAAVGGGAGFMGAAAAMGGRGADPKNPLFVELKAPTSARGTLIRMATSVLVAFVVVSGLTALMDEKGVGRAMGMNSSKHVQEAEGTNVRFEDVKGVAEAKAELEEIVLYLKDPSKFTRLGGKLPRGLLLTGPPGTGKTLLAKAIAGEAGVPFFFSSGSQFEEVYVGLGAKRVRELFEAAKKKAPAIIFIDEIDAVGGTRKLKDQSALKMTLNELLVQLDGFDENNGIIVIGATNFMESLDQALLRPGRFDKHVTVPLPDVGGRKEILEMYAKKTKLAQDVDLNVLARGTTGFSGADLFNLMNQAALKASVDGLQAITMSVLEYAKDKILMGAERRTAVITQKTARCTAFHEAGHALVATLTKGAQPIHKATIMPRGSSLGMVTMLPEGDQTSQSQREMLAFMDVAMGGRVAEELIFGKEEITSGAMSDLANATKIARNMVTKFGFSDEIGKVYHGGDTGEQSASGQTRSKIDQEVKKLTDESYDRAVTLLKKHSRQHKLLAETLLEYETLTGDEVRDLVKHGRKPKRPVINTEGGQRGDTSVLSVGRKSSLMGGKVGSRRDAQ